MASESTEFLVGVATANIAPEGLVALAGQMIKRIACEVGSPLTP